MKKYYCRILFVFCIFPGLTNINYSLAAESNSGDSAIIKKCKDFRITGDGTTAFWTNTQWIRLTRDNQVNSSYSTQAKVLYSDTGIYFLFDCEDKKITSTMKSDNLNLWEEDVVEVFLWPQEDFPVYFEYELSPLNFELPILVPNNKGKFLGWLPWNYDGDRKIQHATSVTGGKKESGASISKWVAEFFIPYKLLTPLGKVPPKSGTHWRANMYRIDHDNEQVAFSWQKTDRSFHEYNKFGTFIFE